MSHPTAKEINPLVNSDEQSGGGSDVLRYASDPSPEQAATLPKLLLSPVDPTDSFAGRCKQALLLAEEAFAKTGSWVIFFREVLGAGGIVRQLFDDAAEYQRFIEGTEFRTLHEMLAAIRSQDQAKSDAAEPERMITIRIPRSLHEALQEESTACGLSINKLAISKLLWPANSRYIPEQSGRRRGRRPGPQAKRSTSLKTSRSTPDPESGSPAQTASQRDGHWVIESRGSAHSWADRPLPGSGGIRTEE